MMKNYVLISFSFLLFSFISCESPDILSIEDPYGIDYFSEFSSVLKDQGLSAGQVVISPQESLKISQYDAIKAEAVKGGAILLSPLLSIHGPRLSREMPRITVFYFDIESIKGLPSGEDAGPCGVPIWWDRRQVFERAGRRAAAFIDKKVMEGNEGLQAGMIFADAGAGRSDERASFLSGFNQIGDPGLLEILETQGGIDFNETKVRTFLKEEDWALLILFGAGSATLGLEYAEARGIPVIGEFLQTYKDVTVLFSLEPDFSRLFHEISHEIGEFGEEKQDIEAKERHSLRLNWQITEKEQKF